MYEYVRKFIAKSSLADELSFMSGKGWRLNTILAEGTNYLMIWERIAPVSDEDWRATNGGPK